MALLKTTSECCLAALKSDRDDFEWLGLPNLPGPCAPGIIRGQQAEPLTPQGSNSSSHIGIDEYLASIAPRQ
jgi:hypothetical protein